MKRRFSIMLENVMGGADPERVASAKYRFRLHLFTMYHGMRPCASSLLQFYLRFSDLSSETHLSRELQGRVSGLS